MKRIEAMLATLTDASFDSEDYVFELKFDGYRALASIEKGHVDLYSRNLKDFSQKFPSIVDELKKIKEDVLLDGEIIAYDKRGTSSFQALQHLGQDEGTRLEYVIFDFLFFKGKDMTTLPLIRRKSELEKLLKKYPTLTYSTHIEENGKAFFAQAGKLGMEGIIAKRKDSLYLKGKRSDAWLKIKHHKTDEGIIVGFTEPRGSRKKFGALVLAQYKGNDELAFIGHTGTGFNDKSLEELYAKMKPLVTKASPFADKIPLNAPITWIKPKLVAQLKFAEWTKSGVMRQPVFLGLREDKTGKHVHKEKVVSVKQLL